MLSSADTRRDHNEVAKSTLSPINTNESNSDMVDHDNSNETIETISLASMDLPTSQPAPEPRSSLLLDPLKTTLSFKSLGFLLAVTGLVVAIYTLRLTKWSADNDHWNTCSTDLSVSGINCSS